jgi:hypothetical protein
MPTTKTATKRRFFSGIKLLFALFFFPAFAFSQTNASPPTNASPTNANPVLLKDSQAPAFQFKEEAWDFGTIPEGIPVTHIFEYSNSGKQPLIVSQATASCGCTTPVWTKEPVMSGKTGTITVTYNSAKEGSFTKTVTVLSNTGEPKYLTIKGNVIPKKPVDNSNAPNQQ